MSRPIEVIITSGGTISKLDDVRHIGNFSRGTTGSLIAEEFLKSGATVHYIHGREAKRPFRSSLVVDPTKPKDEEMERAARAYDEFSQYAANLHEYQIETFEEYFKTVKRLLTEGSPDVIVLAAAVGDYGGSGQEGKISSDEEFLRLELQRNPKVISLVKQWNPKVFQVGFKLLSRSSLDNLIEVAYQNGIKTHSNLTVANTLIDGDFKRRVAVFITPEKGLIPVSLSELAPRLVEVIHQRVSKSHYRTEVNTASNYATELSDEIAIFQYHTRRLWGLNLFEPYFEGSDKQFGFVATRVPSGGFLITSRGSNKRDIPLEDIVYVPEVDFESRTVYVNSSGKKASLNANVAAKIFQERPDINVILHAHVFPGVDNQTSTDYSPGTQEDVDEVLSYLRNEERIVELVNHGIISVGKDLDDVVATLDVEPAYMNFPELYDAIYHRFQQSTEFVDLVGRIVGHDETVLDLAAGTGDVSKALQERGYKNISLADKSDGMLRVARRKLGYVPTHVTSMRSMDLGQTYDAIVIRQAINYLMDYDSLVDGLRRMHEHLNEGGRLIFNAPNFNGNAEYGNRFFEYEHEDYNVKVREMNVVDGRVITHSQHCVLMKKDGSEIKKVYDLNRFGLFTAEEFTRALQEVGFQDIKLLGKGMANYVPESKTLYCVAIK
ncbi:MAG: phosphopantothenoylcysteine decarboxylase domain-containing protein [Candidatus Heimdallarchaeaceae archaeon]